MADPLAGKSYDSTTPLTGKTAQSTDLLKPGAREPYATGKNNANARDTTKHKPFGKLGLKGHP